MIKLGKRIAIIAMLLALLCIAPIALYIAFGPEDGNPIGLGLLMVIGMPFFSSISVIGLGIWAVGEIRLGKNQRNSPH
ncbi:MAG: hypothetical protein M0Q95_08930 [Porticoccaceae bacterium]|nr:hypothetical protein [Porticoccaceae bacterium]